MDPGRKPSFGEASLQEDLDRQREELRLRRDQDRTRGALNQAQLGLREWLGQMRGRRGLSALSLPEEAEAEFGRLREELAKSLEEGRQREMFGPGFQAGADLAREQAARHYHEQLEAYGRETRAAQNQLLTDQATETLLQPGGRDKVLAGPLLPIYAENLDRLNDALPPEAREEARRLGLASFHRRQLDALAEANPAEALAYLADERAGSAFEPAERERLAAGLTRLGEERLAAAAARERLAGGLADAKAGLTSEEAAAKYRGEGLTESQAAEKLAAHRAGRTALRGKQVAEQAGRLSELRKSYAESGFDPLALPAELKPTAAELASLLSWGERAGERGGRDDPPDLARLLWLEGLARSELQDRLLAEGGMEELYARAGGADSPALAGILAKAGGKPGARLADSLAGWAAKRFARDLRLDLGSDRDGREINRFALAFAEKAREARAGQKAGAGLSQDDRERIYARLLLAGGWEAGEEAGVGADGAGTGDGARRTADDEFWGSGGD